MKRPKGQKNDSSGNSGMDRIRDYMTAPVHAVESGTTIQAAALKMKQLGIGSLLVSQEKEYVGIVTRTDLASRVIADGMDPQSHNVSEIMSSPVIFIDPDATLEEADQLMGRHRIGHLLVKRGEEVTGIVSVRNLMLYFVEAQSESSEKRGYVRLPFTALVKYLDSEQREYHSLTYDINGGGIFIQTEKPFPIGSEIELQMTLPNDGKVIKSGGIVSWLKNEPREIMKARGEIVYVKRQRQKLVTHPGGMGVKFTDISEGDRVAVMEFVSEIINRISPAQDTG
jgi:CBS domain-containing protein/Tfp pilus assembly protein PilZ